MEINATIILQIFIFMSLLLWLSRVLFAPILRLFDERERRIEGAKTEASQMSLLADEKGRLFDEQYQRAREKARESLAFSQHSLEKEHHEIITRAKTLAKEKVEKAQILLEEEQIKVRPELENAIGTIAQDIIQAITKQTARRDYEQQASFLSLH